MKTIRQLHTYLGLIFAPSIIFYALSGALQLFGLHEGSHPAWIATLSQVHRDQRLSAPAEKRQDGVTPAQSAEMTPEPAPVPHSKPSVPLKGFFLSMAFGLILSTLLGIYMAFRTSRRRWILWGILTLGTAIPATLLLL